ncbi:PLC-like phosphodiesterase [Epithele typhae]|uniref:PLC-like phosphodiesterase n=1 Tax=Epithele typhae TaxID=378194 RepID=UPI0020086D6B|nr:PLC-like phosphodiesterase [Epithele typhae]KAH9927528.1 PLC-like phosphodiesterase [Epithele typhae]
MYAPWTVLFNLASDALFEPLAVQRHTRFYDVQAHRGGRGNTVENTLPSFAWGLIDGASTLELDNGITKDGHVVVWHDEEITAAKCRDTRPAFQGDPDFPYVGKFIANLTLPQLRTVDCGSKRQFGYPMQLVYPGTRISTMQEVFDFVLWNIESKINARHPNQTRSVEDFVQKQYKLFSNSPYKQSITYQSFDWRSIVAMKELDPSITTSALIDDDTAANPEHGVTPWLAGLNLDSFPARLSRTGSPTPHIASRPTSSPPRRRPAGRPVPDPDMDGYVPFTTREMIDTAHRLGMKVKPWTVNRNTIVEELLEWKADGIISDYPNVVRRLVKHRGLPVAPKYPKQRVLACLQDHLEKQADF